MTKIKQTKIPMELTEDNILKVAIEQGVIENEFNWRLVRENNGLNNQSEKIKWIEWNNQSQVKEMHDSHTIGRSLIMSPLNKFFTWMTTSVTEILEEKEGYLKFKTKNSVYELYMESNSRI